MHFDALTLAAVVDELQDTVVGGRVQQIVMTDPYSIGMEIYASASVAICCFVQHPTKRASIWFRENCAVASTGRRLSFCSHVNICVVPCLSRLCNLIVRIACCVSCSIIRSRGKQRWLRSQSDGCRT